MLSIYRSSHAKIDYWIRRAQSRNWGLWYFITKNKIKMLKFFFRWNMKLNKEDPERPNYGFKRYGENNKFLYVTCVGELKPKGKPSKAYKRDLCMGFIHIFTLKKYYPLVIRKCITLAIKTIFLFLYIQFYFASFQKTSFILILNLSSSMNMQFFI